MDIKLLSAVKHWFNTSSYDMVYLEAMPSNNTQPSES